MPAASRISEIPSPVSSCAMTVRPSHVPAWSPITIPGTKRPRGFRGNSVRLFGKIQAGKGSAIRRSSCSFWKERRWLAVPLDTIKDTIRGSAKRLTGRVAKATSGRMRIGSKFAELPGREGQFRVRFPASGQDFAYIEPAGAPLHGSISGIGGSRDSIALLDLENSKILLAATFR